MCDDDDDDDEDDDVGGSGVKKRSARCAVAELTLSADHCRWSTGSPEKSSYHSPGPLDPRHLLVETKRKEHLTERKLSQKNAIIPQIWSTSHASIKQTKSMVGYKTVEPT